MNPPAAPVHPLDHLVLPVGDLAAARARLSQLGFTVAPDGVHPFGTENCCVYFSGDMFLEPLAVRDETLVRAEAARGNVFVARHADFWQRGRVDGFSAVVFGTVDAAGDDAGFRAKSISAGAMLNFSRPFTDHSGRNGTASFRLAFAADPHDVDVFFFTCERVATPSVDRASLQNHANGTSNIERVVLRARQPANHAGILLDTSGASHAEGMLSSSIRIHVPNATIDILSPTDLSSEYGFAAMDNDGLHAAAIVFASGDGALTEALLRRNLVSHSVIGNRLIVPPAPGQGATFIFEDPS